MAPQIDLLCFSHLRWDAAHPRVQELLRRAGRERRVFYVEEPVFDDGRPHLNLRRTPDDILIAVPTLPLGTGPRRGNAMQRELINHLIGYQGITRFVLWFWSPAAIAFTDHLAAAAVIYDCLDEPAPSRRRGVNVEEQILGAADVVFATSLIGFQAKRVAHPNVHHIESAEPDDHAAWDRTWSVIARQIDRIADGRPPLHAAK